MKWKKGFRRIALLFSIVAGIAGAVFYGIKTLESYDWVHYAQQELESAQLEFNKYERLQQKFTGLDHLQRLNVYSVFISSWKDCKTFEEQNRQWKVWTGEYLSSANSKKLTGERETTEPNVVDYEKAKGWQIVSGEALPYSLVQVGTGNLLKNHCYKEVEKAQARLREAETKVPCAEVPYPVFIGACAVVGFGAFWLMYLILERIVSWFALLVLWIAAGFRDATTEHKSSDEDKASDLVKMAESIKQDATIEHKSSNTNKDRHKESKNWLDRVVSWFVSDSDLYDDVTKQKSSDADNEVPKC